MTIATAKSVFAAGRDNIPRDLISGGEMGNKVRRAYAKYVFLGTESNACVIEMFTLPKDAIILPISSLYTQDGGTDFTLAVGDGTTADKYLTAVTGVTAARTAFTIEKAPVKLLAPTTFYVTIAGGGSHAVTAGQYIELEVYYTTPN